MIYRNTHVIFDCDGVLLDWLGGFRAWVGENIPSITLPAEEPTDFALGEWMGTSQAYCLRTIERFNASEKFGELLPLPGAVEAVSSINRHSLTVLTSCSDDPLIVARRQANIREVFGIDLPAVICLPLGKSKLPSLQTLRKGIWIEDNYKNALVGARAGHRTYMLRRSHNRNDERTTDDTITWIDDLRPIVSLLT